MHWEYIVDAFPIGGPLSTGAVDPTIAAEKLNEFGAKGWELVSSYPTAGGNGGTKMLVFVYKRPRHAPATAADMVRDEPVIFRRDPAHS
jgi:hypothetical protein